MSDDKPPPAKILVVLIIVGLLIPAIIFAPPVPETLPVEQKQPEGENGSADEVKPLRVSLDGLTGEPRRIVWCESGDDPKACNEEFGCIAGMGLWMFISSTWNKTLDRMIESGASLPYRCWEKVRLPISEERTEVVFDAECNLLVGLWLYEMDGDVHWRPYSGKCYLNN